LLLSLVGGGTLAVAMGFAPSVGVFVPLLVAFAFIADLYRPAASAIIADLVPSADRAIAFAALRLAINLGWGSGVAVGGLLADMNWRLLFWGDGATTLAFGALIYALVGETRGAPDTAGAEAVGSPWRDSVFVKVILASFIFSMAFFMDIIVLPLTVTESAGYPARVFGFLVATNGFLIAMLELTAVGWLARFRRLRVAALGIALTALGMGITGLVMHWAWFLLAILLYTAGEILTIPQQSAFLADWAPPALRGRYLGIAQASWGLGWAVAPVVFLPLHARVSEAVFWAILGLGTTPAALIMLRLDRSSDRDELLRGRAVVEAGAVPPTA
jgi:MFS family permease